MLSLDSQLVVRIPNLTCDSLAFSKLQKRFARFFAFSHLEENWETQLIFFIIKEITPRVFIIEVSIDIRRLAFCVKNAGEEESAEPGLHSLETMLTVWLPM